MLHACGSDPAILPRNLHPLPPPADDPLALGPPTTQWTLVMTQGKEKAYEVPSKYCKTCNIQRPPRSHHCRICDNCVDTHDHHCVWLNTCIGRRNYRFFLGFVWWTSALALLLVGCSVAQIAVYGNKNRVSFAKSIGATTDNRVAMFLFLFGEWIRADEQRFGAAVLMSFGQVLLVLSTLWLLDHITFSWFTEGKRRGNTSTRISLCKSKLFVLILCMRITQLTRYRERHRPFDEESFWRNFLVVCCRPRGPSYMEFKKSTRTNGHIEMQEL